MGLLGWGEPGCVEDCEGWGWGERAGTVGGIRRAFGVVVENLYPMSLPAFQVAEIQKIELPVILSMIDGVHILGEVELAHTCSPPPPLPPPSRSHLPNSGSLPNAPIAPPHGSAAHCSHTGQRRSQRSHLWGSRRAGSTRGKGVRDRFGGQGKVKVILYASVLGSCYTMNL